MYHLKAIFHTLKEQNLMKIRDFSVLYSILLFVYK
nr:MAG TPA: hypothetical protein [Crassvirales sp.]DAR56524.1 MAG TPA: hypothetical protein [Crassvirales sp.]